MVTWVSWVSLLLLIGGSLGLILHRIKSKIAFDPVMGDDGTHSIISKDEFGSEHKLLSPENIMYLKERGTFAIEEYYKDKKVVMTFGSYNLYDAHASLKESYDHGSPFDCYMCGNNAPAINSVEATIILVNRNLNIAHLNLVRSGKSREVRVCRNCIRQYHGDILERKDIPNIPSKTERIVESL